MAENEDNPVTPFVAAPVRVGVSRRRPAAKWVGWVLLLLPFVILGYQIARITPMYMNYQKVSRSLDQVAAGFHEGDNPETLAHAITQQFQKENVLYPEAKDVTISRDGLQWVIEAKYDDQTWLFFNVGAEVSFDKTVRAPKTVSP